MRRWVALLEMRLFLVLTVLKQTMYAVLYGYAPVVSWYECMKLILSSWTPEIFGTKVRGTACGIASALSRMYVLSSHYY